MRVRFAAVSALLLVAFSGCVDADGNPITYGGGSPSPFYEPVEDVEEAPPENVSVPAEPEPTPPTAPVITSVATATVTAPIEIAIDRFERDGFSLSLLAGPDGIRCVAEQVARTPTPTGFKAVGEWTSCTLSVGNITFAHGHGDGFDQDFLMMADLPVESFLWNMTLARTLVNNTGEHQEALLDVSRTQSPAPQATARHAASDLQPSIMYGTYYEVCDGGAGFESEYPGVQTIVFIAEAHNGRAWLEVDLSDYNVLDIQGPQRVANETNPAETFWDGAKLVAHGPWAHESAVRVTATIDFDGAQGSLNVGRPSDECPLALWRDVQSVTVEARAEGIAAGWEDTASRAARFMVRLTGL